MKSDREPVILVPWKWRGKIADKICFYPWYTSSMKNWKDERKPSWESSREGFSYTRRWDGCLENRNNPVLILAVQSYLMDGTVRNTERLWQEAMKPIRETPWWRKSTEANGNASVIDTRASIRFVSSVWRKADWHRCRKCITSFLSQTEERMMKRTSWVFAGVVIIKFILN